MDRFEPGGVNAPQIEYWNGPAGDRWARLVDTQENMLGPLGLVAMDACDIRPGHSVLDVGCGSGTTSFELTRRVGESGRVVGIDVSAPMLQVGRERLNSSDIKNLTLENKDAAAHRFEDGEFDRVFSRFGIMFFLEPVSAFSNMRRSIAKDGRLAFVCWQEATKNPWIDVPLRVVLEHVPQPPPTDPYAPGPMAFADPDHVRKILTDSGFSNMEVTELQTRIPIASDVPASVEKLLEIGPVSRLICDASHEAMHQIRKELHDAISECQTERGVMMGSTTWVVSATPMPDQPRRY